MGRLSAGIPIPEISKHNLYGGRLQGFGIGGLGDYSERLGGQPMEPAAIELTEGKDWHPVEDKA